MAIIYIPVEVPDADVAKFLAYHQIPVAELSVTQPVPPTREFTRTESEFGYQVQSASQPADPWASPATGAPSIAAPGLLAPTPTAPAATSTPPVTYQPGGNPHCSHGEMRFVAAGVSKSTGRAYGAFYGCPAPRGQTQCKSIKVGQ